MSDFTPPAEAVEAAARALWSSCNPNGPAWRATSEEYREQARAEARAALTAAGPIIERAVRDRIEARDDARQQVADLRAGIGGLLPGETVNVYAGGGNLVSQRRVVDPDHLRTLLAGSGEQPGERARCSECGPGYRVGDEGCRHRPAPVVPDNADVRERVIEAGVKAIEASRHGRWLVMPGPVSIQRQVATLVADAALAVVGQGVTAEQAWDEGYAAGLRDATHGEPGGQPNPYRAAVRPTGQEGS